MARLSVLSIACLAAFLTVIPEPVLAQQAAHERYNRCMRDAGDAHRACIRGCDRSQRTRIGWNQCSNRCAQMLRRCDQLRPPPRRRSGVGVSR